MLTGTLSSASGEGIGSRSTSKRGWTSAWVGSGILGCACAGGEDWSWHSKAGPLLPRRSWHATAVDQRIRDLNRHFGGIKSGRTPTIEFSTTSIGCRCWRKRVMHGPPNHNLPASFFLTDSSAHVCGAPAIGQQNSHLLPGPAFPQEFGPSATPTKTVSQTLHPHSPTRH